MKTDTISQSSNKGRHVTSHRELIVLESGGILIDNPGMREVGIADAENGLELTFERGEIDKNSYKNYLKMEREKAHFESTIEEKRKKDKEFGKVIKNYKKEMKKNKF